MFAGVLTCKAPTLANMHKACRLYMPCSAYKQAPYGITAHIGASAQVPHLHQALRRLHLLQRAIHLQDALVDALPRLTQPHEGAR